MPTTDLKNKELVRLFLSQTIEIDKVKYINNWVGSDNVEFYSVDYESFNGLTTTIVLNLERFNVFAREQKFKELFND